MKSIRFTAPYSDEAIVAWLDGEMEASDARRFEAALAEDTQLAARTNALRVNQQEIASAFAPLLNEAPQSRMEHNSPPCSPGQRQLNRKHPASADGR